MAKSTTVLAVGLMSGTSADGVDAALIETDGESVIEFLGGLTIHYEEDIRLRLLDASQHDVPIGELLRLEKEITQLHAEATKQLLAEQKPARQKAKVIGFHGHTVRHLPNDGITLQLGNPWLLAHSTGIQVVSDFRRNDMAAGGQGAPLVSMFHRALFTNEELPTLVLNLGGVANVTWLGPGGEIIAGDTGPGCGLLDEWVQEMADMLHDRDGILAKKGRVSEEIVSAALKTPFFSKPLPRSADRYDFDHVDVSGLSVEDGAATLCATTVQAIAEAVARLPTPPQVVWVTGGGVHHPVIMQMLTNHFGDVRSVKDHGLNPDTLEAECFAWLAVRRLKNLPLTIPETTGCENPMPGGMVTF